MTLHRNRLWLAISCNLFTHPCHKGKHSSLIGRVYINADDPKPTDRFSNAADADSFIHTIVISDRYFVTLLVIMFRQNTALHVQIISLYNDAAFICVYWSSMYLASELNSMFAMQQWSFCDRNCGIYYTLHQYEYQMWCASMSHIVRSIFGTYQLPIVGQKGACTDLHLLWIFRWPLMKCHTIFLLHGFMATFV